MIIKKLYTHTHTPFLLSYYIFIIRPNRLIMTNNFQHTYPTFKNNNRNRQDRDLYTKVSPKQDI